MIDSERSLYGWIEPFLVVPAESLSYSVATVCGGEQGREVCIYVQGWGIWCPRHLFLVRMLKITRGGHGTVLGVFLVILNVMLC